MITCINQGPNGPTFSKLKLFTNCFTHSNATLTIQIDALSNGDTVILDKKNAAILARKILAWTGEATEVPPVVTGDL